MVDRQQLVELVANSLGRHDLEPIGHRDDGGVQLVGRFELIAGDEAGGSHHPQRVVAEAHLGRHRRAQRRRREIGHTTERIDELGSARLRRQFQRHRVDGEVATLQVGFDVVGERHVGLARVVAVDLGTERRDVVDPGHSGVGVDLVGADRPESLALGPHARPPNRPDRP